MNSSPDIYGNMEASETPRYKASQSMIEDNVVDEQTRQLLAQLISTSADLDVRVWLDGVYTNVEDTRPRGDWLKGREVYFKAEGRVPGVKDLKVLSKGET